MYSRKVFVIFNMYSYNCNILGTKGQGPCLGDSGGGLFIHQDGKWYIRGIISTSLANRQTQVCDVNSYAVYVDIAKYLLWIVEYMKY